MANETVAALTAAVEKATSVEKSAELLIDGFQARLDAAIQLALAGGATADELKPLADLSAALDAESDALAAAVTANTPAA